MVPIARGAESSRITVVPIARGADSSRIKVITIAPGADTSRIQIEAKEKGEEIWETEIDGSKWSQNTFNYQAKCLQWINAEFFNLSSDDQNRILDLFSGTGCEKLIMSHK